MDDISNLPGGLAVRSRLAALSLLAVLLMLSAINLPAAPVPDPSAVLDIGPPRKGKTPDEYCKDQIRRLSAPRGHFLWLIDGLDEVKKLTAAAHVEEKEVGPWLARHLRIKEEERGRRLRLTFRAGTRAEQAAILNALLRGYLRDSAEQPIKTQKGFLQDFEKYAVQCARNAKQYPTEHGLWQKREADTKKGMAPLQAEVDRLKQITVIKWAK